MPQCGEEAILPNPFRQQMSVAGVVLLICLDGGKGSAGGDFIEEDLKG